MASKKLSKRQMRDDEFRDVLAEVYFGAIGYLSEHWKQFAIGFGVLLVCLVGALALWQSHLSSEGHASYLLGQVQEADGAPVQASAPAGRSTQLTFTSEAQKRQAVESRLAEYAKATGSSAPMAAYYKAVAQAESGRPGDAAATVSPLTKDSVLGVPALTLRARIYEGQAQWDKAEADWRALTSVSNATWTPADGWLALGEYYLRRGQKDKAADAFGQVEKAAGKDAGEDPAAKRAKTKLDEMKGSA